METRKSIVLTGGHAGITAYAFLQRFNEVKSGNIKVYFVGVKNAVEGKNTPTIESQILKNVECEFISLTTGRIQSRFSFWTIPSILKIPIGFIQAFSILTRIRPKLIISFGGFAAFPMVIIGFLLRIPIVIHEQTSTAGRTNRITKYFAREIALARNESKKYFKNLNCSVVGNPIAKEYIAIKRKEKISKPPIIFVTGGSRGSIAINNAIEDVVSNLVGSYEVYHQVGQIQKKKFEKLESKIQNQKQMNKYQVFDFLPPNEFSKIIERSDIIISRAGANAVSTTIVTKRPTIFIPLKYSYLDEQTKNALLAQEEGIAKIIRQDDLNSYSLMKNINEITKNWNTMVSSSNRLRNLDINASYKMTQLVLKYI